MEETVNIATFILDDDQELLDLIKAAVDEAGIKNYKLFTDEGLFLKGLTDEIHVCVVDHFLTKLTGLDIVKEIKCKNEHSYVIAYTGMFQPKVIIDYINSGIDRFVDKNSNGHLQQLTGFLHEGIASATKRLDFHAFIKCEREKLKENDNGAL
ncbi:MAG: response regulator [Ferruginibacter sp.]